MKTNSMTIDCTRPGAVVLEQDIEVGNGFEEAFILVAGHYAYDSGVCTWHDDEVVTARITNPLVRVFARYGDSREDDVLTENIKFVGSRKFMESVRGVNITLSDPR